MPKPRALSVPDGSMGIGGEAEQLTVCQINVHLPAPLLQNDITERECVPLPSYEFKKDEAEKTKNG
ncbi:hypothetical protein KL86CLO1_12961 [uncultured Eubacteriales bacterium]|uniref:Uncharacterized protein n=1 Tax=uncultured Eubacteriales bacterium TaxID=172733 RepID=A0A212KFX5_9FIRM|nr:hypothetical protein KL86CLO1_12961 [uncultured Eubacteriales bacterium]